MEVKYQCVVCREFASKRFTTVLNHICSTHGEGPCISFACSIDGCKSCFTTKGLETFHRHVYRNHHSMVSSVIQSAAMDNPSSEEMDVDDPTTTQESPEFSCDHPSSFHCQLSPLQILVAAFLLRTLEERFTTEAALDGIIEDVTEIWETALDAIDSSLKAYCSVRINDLHLPECVLHPFRDLETDYKRHIIFKEHFDLLDPVQRQLGQEIVNLGGRIENVSDFCYDVPLLPTIQHLLKCEIVSYHVLNPHNSEKGVLGDICDGNLFKRNQLFKDHPDALQLHLYYDEVEVCNPIGSKKKLHKLGLLYFTLDNLPPPLRSRLNCIYLLSVSKYEYVSKYGIDKILEPFVDDIKQLERGVEFQIEGQQRVLYGTVTVISADNLSAQTIGGYKQLNSAFRRCRVCMATNVDMQTKFSEEDFIMRDKETHASHCAELDGPLKDHYATTYGILRDSILNTTLYVHTAECLPQDGMHDFNEGVLKLVVKLLLNYFIMERKWFRLKVFNDRINMFEWGSCDKRNRPTLLSSDMLKPKKVLCQSASQMWCLARALPMLIGDLVPIGDKHWTNFTTLLTIMDYAFALKISAPTLESLQELVHDFLPSFKALYPGESIIPKMHYMVHLVTNIKRVGPLVHSWCMRFKGKHHHLKHIANVTGNFKNIPLTIAKRHQRYMCYQLLQREDYLCDKVEPGKTERVILSTLDESALIAVSLSILPQSQVLRSKKVCIKGTTYYTGEVVMLPSDIEPVFSVIQYLVKASDDEAWHLVLKVLETVEYDVHYHAFRVSHSSSPLLVVCSQATLVDPHPLILNRSFNGGTESDYYVHVIYSVY